MPEPKRTQHRVDNGDGTFTEFASVPVMTLDEMRAAGVERIADPAFVADKVAEAVTKLKAVK